jgi:hypothetical protein
VGLGAVEVPFSVTADVPFAAAFTNIRVVGASSHEDILDCAAVMPQRVRTARNTTPGEEMAVHGCFRLAGRPQSAGLMPPDWIPSPASRSRRRTGTA